MPSLRSRRLGALLSGALVATALVVAVPAAAHAETLDPGNRLGDLTFDVTSGALSSAGDPNSITTTVGCPAGYRLSSRVLMIWEDGSPATAFPALVKTTADTGSGLDGQAIDRTAASAARWVTAGFPITQFKPGLATYVVTCDPGAAPDGLGTFPGGGLNGAPNDPSAYLVGNAKYFSTQIRFDTNAKTWAQVTSTPVKTATTTTLAASGVTGTSATLTATVSPSAATGTVQFKKDGANFGSPVSVTNGTAPYTATGLTAGGTYAFTAEYSGDATHEASATGVSTIVTTTAPADTSGSEVTVTVPTEIPSTPQGLKITAKPATTLPLTGPATRNEGQAWAATGQLGEVTVTDDRRNGAGQGWTLTGAATAFAAGANQVAASNLTWTPEKVSGAGAAGTAGALGTLATGAASASTNVATTVKAGLSLNVPSGTPAGAYTSTLTLTLI
jgi:hypothetical protein